MNLQQLVILEYITKILESLIKQGISDQITAYKKARYYGIATNKVLEPKI